MSKINPPPELSTVEYGKSVDSGVIEILIQQAISDISGYTGNFTADWLISGNIGSSKWITRNSGREESRDGKWINTINIDFHHPLPDGTDLCDAPNKKLLTSTQKLAFWARNGNLSWFEAPAGWASYINWLKGLCYWLTLHENKFHPKEYAFRILEHEDIKTLGVSYCTGGWVRALDLIPRTLDILTKELYGNENSSESVIAFEKIPVDLVSKIQSSLETIGVFEPKRKTISRKWIEEKIHAPRNLLCSHIYVTFISQIGRISNSHDLHSGKAKRRSHKVARAKKRKPRTHRDTSFSLRFYTYTRTLVEAYRYEPDCFPNPDSIDLDDIRYCTRKLATPSRHTPVLPLNIGLQVLCNSLEWVIKYGDAFVDATLAFCKERLISRKMFRSSGKRWKMNRDSIISILNNTNTKSDTGEPNSKSLAETFGLDTRARTKASEDFRDLLNAYIGACAISIAFLKPSRASEISRLQRNCLIDVISQGSAFWLRFELGKSGESGINNSTIKPIPSITAMAITQLQRLGGDLRNIFNDDSSSSKLLFYYPVGQDMRAPAADNMRDNINKCIDKFCDTIELPLDEVGSRWYVRTHEMRKFFIIMLYWHGKFNVLDAIRWIAGHTSASHVHDYSDSNSPGREICRIEAEYVDHKLLKLDREDHKKESSPALLELYKDVCTMFNVSKIEAITQKSYLEHLTTLRLSNALEVRPYIIETANNDGPLSIDIAVRYKEKADERYYD